MLREEKCVILSEKYQLSGCRWTWPGRVSSTMYWNCLKGCHLAPTPTSKGSLVVSTFSWERAFRHCEVQGHDGTVTMSNNSQPFPSANGFKVWQQQWIITRARGDMPVTFRLTSAFYCATVASTSTCIIYNSFTTPFSPTESSGPHRDLTIKSQRGSRAFLST